CAAAIIAALVCGAVANAAPAGGKSTAAPVFVPSSAQLVGLRIVISAGPTFEDLDPVRYVGNRSSGKMGYALAAAAAKQGADVVLISGPVHQTTPPGVQRIDVRSAAQMRDAVLGAFPADIYIGAAAVADYTPKRVVSQKIKKTGQTLTLELVRTPDILSEVAAQTGALKLVVGFAAETHDVEHYARGKLAAKRLDLIIANQVGIEGGGFESDNNAATAYWQGGEQAFPSSSKTELADQLLALIAERLQA
ncbi:phosphopantothenoylcysteine decarboxylase, partial [Xanthomonas vasicola pv. vasculorum NCPPB 895]|uniref:bifunctional phosphopantothenoylcysteine decarboxylase/phosphopantothenate--cysteine ligase CoaBC n=1 Tax=Xanthomonas vasicola TaxID=56459 RepID=UPI0004D7E7D6